MPCCYSCCCASKKLRGGNYTHSQITSSKVSFLLLEKLSTFWSQKTEMNSRPINCSVTLDQFLSAMGPHIPLDISSTVFHYACLKNITRYPLHKKEPQKNGENILYRKGIIDSLPNIPIQSILRRI